MQVRIHGLFNLKKLFGNAILIQNEAVSLSRIDLYILLGLVTHVRLVGLTLVSGDAVEAIASLDDELLSIQKWPICPGYFSDGVHTGSTLISNDTVCP